MFPELAKDPTNIVKITYREHYICHWLLTKIYPSKEMDIAFWTMNSANSSKYVNECARDVHRLTFKKLMSGEANGMYGKRKELNPTFGTHLSEEIKLKFSQAQKRSYENPQRHEIQKNAAKKGSFTRKYTGSHYCRIMCVETAEVFSSLREAERVTNIDRNKIAISISKNSSIDGLTFIKISKEDYAKEKTTARI